MSNQASEAKTTKTAKKQVWPYVKPWVYADGTRAYSVDTRTKTGGGRKFFATKELADVYARAQRTARQNAGARYEDNSVVNSDASEAAYVLKDFPGVTLTDAARFYRDHNKVAGLSKTVAAVTAECIDDMTSQGLKPRTVKDFRIKVQNGFGEVFGARSIGTILSSEIKDWVRSLPVAPVTSNGYRRNVHMLFAFAKREKYIGENPVTDIKAIKFIEEPTGILTTTQVNAFMAAAVKLAPDAVPMFALNVFAGLRPEAESFRLDWSMIDLERGIIDVSFSKNTMSERFIHMAKDAPNLMAWLKPYAKTSGAVGPIGDSYHTRRQACQKAAGIADWESDVLRHTFASMHLEFFGSTERTALVLGHGGSIKMLARKYRAKVKPADAKAFWEIMPATTPAAVAAVVVTE